MREGSAVPTLVFVANRHIAPGTELTVDYGGQGSAGGGGQQQQGSYDGGAAAAVAAVGAAAAAGEAASEACRVGAVPCLCATSACRGFLPFDPRLGQ